MTTIIRYLNKKAQGIVEYALLLAFIVGLGMTLNGVGIKDSVINVFDDVATLLSGEKITFAEAVNRWGNKSTEELLADASSSAKRQLTDQESLANIGNLFLGKTKTELAVFMNNYDHNVNKTDGLFICNYHDPEWTAKNEQNKKADPVFDYDGSQLKEGYRDILTYMQGDSDNMVSFTNDGTKYYFSDSMTVERTTGGDWINDRSIRVNLHYNGDTVDAVRVRVNRGSIGANDKNYYRELDVKVGTGKSWKQTIDGEAGAITGQESSSVNNSWYDLNNW